MNIGVTGKVTRFEELKQTLPEALHIIFKESFTPEEIADCAVFFDLSFEEQPDRIKTYASVPGTLFLLSAVTLQLGKVAHEAGMELPLHIMGFNALPGFINRSVKEISRHHEGQKENIARVETLLKWKAGVTHDRVGMVSPRILFMIMNEAYFTLQEGTAGKEDIDTAMMLGTNYPMGPFAWAKKIGIKTVVEVLDAVYHDTHDARYKVCPLLRTESYQ